MDSAQANLVDPVQVRAALERILSAQPFQQSETLSRFLRYAVEHALDGHGEKLKEYSLGLGVFSRAPSFDPRLDSIVRVEATRLRARLAEYYADQGKDDALRIELPKGTYTPKFHVTTPPKAAQVPLGRQAVSGRMRRVVWAGIAVCLGGMA